MRIKHAHRANVCSICLHLAIFTSSQSWAYNNSRELPNQSKKQSILHVLKPKGMEHPTHVACLFGSVGVYHGDVRRFLLYDYFSKVDIL